MKTDHGIGYLYTLTSLQGSEREFSAYARTQYQIHNGDRPWSQSGIIMVSLFQKEKDSLNRVVTNILIMF
jgi:hypothetical protein